ncbi:hypothetical protein ACFE04_007318 [Oxalis oulophora]
MSSLADVPEVETSCFVIDFKYQNDFVLVVNKTSYKSCIVANPIDIFKYGNTTFEFDRYGYFYFISGEHGHCQAGEKLVVRVMVHPLQMAPQFAPSPSERWRRWVGLILAFAVHQFYSEGLCCVFLGDCLWGYVGSSVSADVGL